MIQTIRIILAGLLHILAAKIDVYDTYLVELDTQDGAMEEAAIAHNAMVERLRHQASMN